MSRQKIAMTAVAGAAVIGVGLYSNTKGRKDQPKDERHSANAKRDMGLSGAGVGGNAMAGSTDVSAAKPSPHKDPERKTRTTAPIEKLPSGGVGGGEGGGGSSARKTQLPTGPAPDGVSLRGKDDDAQGTSARRADSKAVGNHTERPGVLGSIQGFFGQGGSKTASPADSVGRQNTHGISEMGNDIPSKHGPPASSK